MSTVVFVSLIDSGAVVAFLLALHFYDTLRPK